jgi:hypothetical protein
MGGKTSKETVTNELQNIVNQTSTQLVKIMSQSTINVTSHILQTQKATISSTTNLQNIIDIGTIEIRNGNVTLDQLNNVKVTVGSILNIVQTSDIVSSISTQITNDVMSQVNQSAALTAQVSASSQITNSQKTSGEANNFIDKITAALSIGGSDDENTLTNNITSIINETITSTTDIESFVSNTVTINIKQSTITDCLQTNNIYNMFKTKSIILDGGSLSVDQSNFLDNYFSCFVSSQMSSTDLQNIAAGILNNSTNSTGQGTSVSDTLTSSLSQLASTIETSFLDNIQYIIIAIVICVIIAGLLLVSSPFLFKAFKKTGIYKKITYTPPPETAPLAPTGPTGSNKPVSQLATAVKNYKRMRINGSNNII